MEQGFDIGVYIAALKRRWLVILAPIILLTPLALLVAYVLPPVYSGTARVLVESQQIPSDLAQSTVTVGVDQRIALIEQRLMTRENLLRVAGKYNVGADMGQMSPTALVDLMRRSTQIVGLRLTGSRGPVTGVDIRFEANRPNTAADVANEFLKLLLEQNLRQRYDRASETAAYFRQERDRLSDEISALERQISEFNKANRDALPESLSFRRQQLADLEQRRFDREMQRIALEDQKLRLNEALKEGAFDVDDSTSLGGQLQNLRDQLTRDSALYAPRHPSIRSLRARIAAVEAQIAEQAASAGAAEAEEIPKSLRVREAERSLNRIEEQLAALETKDREDGDSIESLRRSIDQTAAVALEESDLERRYTSLQSQFARVIDKLAQAETGERLEVNQKAERFEVLERARVPSRPDSPNRPLIAAAGVVVSSGLGFGLALLLELLNKSLRTPADLARKLDLRPTVSIPYIMTEREKRRRRWMWRIVMLALLVVIPLTLLLIDTYVQPLPLLAQTLMDKLGVSRLISLIDARL